MDIHHNHHHDKKHLSIMHFNDVYEIEASKIEPVGGAARFVTVCKKFHERTQHDGLLLFSGDLFSPSTLSVLYKGEQMIDPINACHIDAACVGNHEFDFNLEKIEKLFRKCNFPWLCSNIFNLETNAILANNHAYCIEERGGFRIGIMGLAEKDWLNTITEIDMSSVRYEDFIKCGQELVHVLREDHACDIVIALTHMRVPNDRILAANVPGIDFILGGHDHIVISELINDSTLFIKSGSDFKDYGILEIEPGDFSALTPEEREDLQKNQNTFIVKNKFRVQVAFEHVTSHLEEDVEIAKHVESYVEKSKQEMQKVIGFTLEPLDTRFSELRTQETNFGNFYIDVMRKEVNADVAIMNSGTIRSDCIFPEGEVNYALLNKALPFPDIIIVQQLSGADIVSALENGVSKWPAFEGRFPLVSNIRFEFDGNKPSGARVLLESVQVHNKPIELEKIYSCATKWFVSLGKDGYDMFKNKPYLLDYENGLPHLQIMTSFFKCKDENIVKFNKSDESEEKLIQQALDSLPTAPPLLRKKASSILASESPTMQRIPQMRKLRRQQTRFEKVHESGLIKGVQENSEDGTQFIVIAPQKDGRIINVSEPNTQEK